MRVRMQFGRWRVGDVLLGAVLIASSLPSRATTIFSEDFNDVTGLTSPASVRSVLDVVTNNPNQLPRVDPPGILDFRSIPLSLVPDDVGIRRADNAINTSGGSAGFDNFFSSQFLVLGDRSGPLTGAPTTLAYIFAAPFQLPSSSTSLEISYDWAFDGTDGNGALDPNDVFKVSIFGADVSNLASMFSVSAGVTQLDQHVGPSGFGTGHASFTLSASSLPVNPGSSLYYLAFGLNENLDFLGTTNSAVGIDNISVTAVPIPTALWLLGSSLLGLVTISRRKRID